MSEIDTINDVLNLRSIAAAVTANSGAIAVQNIAGALKQVDDRGTVTSLGGGGTSWASLRAAEMFAAAPALTESVYIKHGANAPYTSITALSPGADANVEGGALKSAGVWIPYSVPTVYQNPSALSWGVAYRAKVPAPVNAQVNYLGLVNAGRTHLAALGTIFSTDATHYVLQLTGTGTTNVISTTVADGLAFHNFMVTFDGTTVKAWMDNVVIASTATLTNLMTDAAYPASDSTAAGMVTEMIYGYVSP